MSGRRRKVPEDLFVSGLWGSPIDWSEAGRQAAMDEILAAGQALYDRNRELSRKLTAQLGGDSGRVQLNEQPDGLGFFYGSFEDAAAKRWRLDVLPPRDLWAGDMGADAADAGHWRVFLDGEEMERAPSIGAPSALVTLMAARAPRKSGGGSVPSIPGA